jgi:hypothetical protein
MEEPQRQLFQAGGQVCDGVSMDCPFWLISQNILDRPKSILGPVVIQEILYSKETDWFEKQKQNQNFSSEIH